MALLLKCPVCRGKFPWVDPAKGFPRQCELCHEYIGHDRADDDVVMPFVRTSGSVAKLAAIDDVYKGMEKGSEIRAEMSGLSGTEASPIKITDLRPTKHEGDIAAPTLSGSALELQKHMEAMNARGAQVGFQGANGVEWSAGSAVGPAPSAGAKARTALQHVHGQAVGGHAISDRPALETTNPGYRRRG